MKNSLQHLHVDTETSNSGQPSDSGSSVWMSLLCLYGTRNLYALYMHCLHIKVPGPLKAGDRERSTQLEKHLHIWSHHNEWNVNFSYLV